MSEALYITIEEWAGEHGIDVSDNQVADLVEALSVDYEAPVGGNSGNGEVESLERKVEMLERFIHDKGFSVDVREDGVMEHTESSISNNHSASGQVFHRY